MALRKCACIDTLYTELDWLDRFQAAKNDGFEAVEFWDWRIRDLDATREAAEKAGIAISGFNGDADYSLVDPTHKQKYLDYLKQSIAAAKKVALRALPFTPTHWATAALLSITTITCPTRSSCARCTTPCSPAQSWQKRKRSTSILRR